MGHLPRRRRDRVRLNVAIAARGTQSLIMDIEKLILCVKKYPMLYDVDHCSYKNLKHKDQIWDEIGDELQENGEELKKKWKNLRDCYARHIRSWDMKTIHTAPYTTRYYKFWPWAKQMEIFKPYLKFAQIYTDTELHECSDSQSTLRLPSNPSESFEQIIKQDVDIPDRTVPPRKRKRETEAAVDKVIKYLKGKKSSVTSDNLNATEYMFLGFAKIIETFSARRQASVKMRIANMVLEEEFFEKEEKDENTLQLQSTITSFTEEMEDKKL